MAVRQVLLLGNPQLYERSTPVVEDEVGSLQPVIADLHDTLMDFRARYRAGRAIAAPQIGVMKRLVYMHIGRPTVFVNPVLAFESDERMELWDDCMCFPELLVKVSRYGRARISYRDAAWHEHEEELDGALSELLQHEVDHLDGVLAVARALGPTAFAHRSQRGG